MVGVVVGGAILDVVRAIIMLGLVAWTIAGRVAMCPPVVVPGCLTLVLGGTARVGIVLQLDRTVAARVRINRPGLPFQAAHQETQREAARHQRR